MMTKFLGAILAAGFLCSFAPATHGQVSFTLTSSPGVGSQPQLIAAGDLNGDGKPDLVTPNGGVNTVSLLTNNGTGGFAVAASPPVGNNPVSVALGDVNGDGRLDIVTANFNTGTLTILTNNGAGGFATALSPAVGLTPLSVIMADVNGDGRADVICANSNQLTVLLNNGSGGFASANNYTVGGTPWSVTSADLNNDGAPDLVSANYADNTLSVLTNNGSGGFVPAGTFAVGLNPRSVIAVDANGDGKPDLVSANFGNSTLLVLTNNGSGGFLPSTTNSVGNGPVLVTAADVNGDGKPDLISANFSGSSLTILTNNGSGGFVTAATLSPTSNTRGVVPVDVNGDGAVDLASANYGLNVVAIYTNGTAFPPASIPVITTSPVGQTNVAGSTVAFSVAAKAVTGRQLFGYRWRLNGTNLPAATNGTLTLANVSAGQAGSYDVVVTNFAGSVTSNPALLDVRDILVRVNGQVADGTATALNSGTVTIVSSQANGFIFYTLDGTTPTVGSLFYNGSLSLSNTAVVRAMSLSADFTQTIYSPAVTVQVFAPFNVTTPGGGSLTINGLPTSPASNYLTGATITLGAITNSGWVFLGWRGSVTSTNNPLTLTMNQTNSVQASFGTFASTNAFGAGSIYLNQPNPLPYGTVITASAIPNSGSYLLTWGGAASGTNTPTAVAITNANPVVSGLFTTLPAGQFSLTVVVIGNGLVTNNPPRSYFSSNDVVTLRPVTNAGAFFLGWSLDATGTNNPLTVSITTNKVIQANFGVLPTVSISPTNLTVLAGSNATLTAAASGPQPLSYQWQYAQAPLSGATAATFTLVNAQPTNAGSYSVVVSNLSGAVTSSVATISVIALPVITNQPVSLTNVVIGHAASFVVGASGWPALAYQWQLGGTNVAGGANPLLVISNAFPANEGFYTVVVTNIYGSVTSSPARLTVLPLNLTSPARIANGQFQFTFDSADGVRYEIKYSTNLLDWYSWLILGGNGQPLTVIDPGTGGNQYRFYRVGLSVP